MAELNDVYSTRILEIAGAMTRTARLKDADATVSFTARPCGSKIDVDLKMNGGRVSDYGHTVKACLLGQASASIMAREIVGSTADELRDIAQQMRLMLREDGPAPTGRWSDLAALEGVKNYKQRYASTLLVFDAVEKALDEIEAQQTGQKAASG